MIQRTLAAGVSPGALEHATLRCWLFSYMNRMVDAFGADVTPEQAEVLAKTLDSVHGRVEGLRGTKPWKRFAGEVPRELLDQLELIRTGEGDSPAELRTAIEARVALAAGGVRDSPAELPEAVAALVDVLAADAHGVEDAHIDALRAAGWSEEAIYEMIWVASFAAGLGRTERAIALLADL